MKLLNRNKAIIELCRNKNVLHLGCIGFTDATKDERIHLLPKTLHAKIHKVAQNLTGLDYSKEVIAEVKDVTGFSNIFYANAEELHDLELFECFETIIVGDVIEHLSNPGLMLNGIKRFCDLNTTIVITTPNAFGIASIFRFLFNKFKEGNEHVMGFNYLNIQNLIERHGFAIKEMNTCYQDHAKKMTFFPVFKGLLSLVPKFGGTLFLTVKKKEKPYA